MSDSFVQPPPNAGGPDVDCEQITTGAGTVQRQRVRIGGLGAAELADFRSALPNATDIGLVVRTPPPNVDTGVVATNTGVLTEDASIAVGQAFLLDGVAFMNSSGAAITVALANGASQYYVAPFVLGAGATVVLQQGGRPMTGLKWSLPTGTTGQAWGRK